MSGLLNLTGVTLPAGPAYLPAFAYMKPDLRISDQLAGLYLFGASEELSLQNLADATKPLTKVGQPSINEVGAVCTNLAHFETGLAESAELTYFAVAKPITGSAGAMLVANYQSATPPTGGNLYLESPSSLRVGVADGGNTARYASQSIAPATPSDYYIFGQRAGAGAVEAFVSHAGAITQTSTAVTGRSVSARTLRIGGHYTASQFTDPVTIAAVAIYRKRLSDLERAATIDDLRAFFSQHVGIPSL